MSRYIDFYLIGELVDSHGNVHYEDLKNLPTADVVEVVRCKDCKHWSKEFKACYMHDFCEIFQSDYYCASGERKEDDKERSD